MGNACCTSDTCNDKRVHSRNTDRRKMIPKQKNSDLSDYDSAVDAFSDDSTTAATRESARISPKNIRFTNNGVNQQQSSDKNDDLVKNKTQTFSDPDTESDDELYTPESAVDWDKPQVTNMRSLNVASLGMDDDSTPRDTKARLIQTKAFVIEITPPDGPDPFEGEIDPKKKKKNEERESTKKEENNSESMAEIPSVHRISGTAPDWLRKDGQFFQNLGVFSERCNATVKTAIWKKCFTRSGSVLDSVSNIAHITKLLTAMVIVYLKFKRRSEPLVKEKIIRPHMKGAAQFLSETFREITQRDFVESKTHFGAMVKQYHVYLKDIKAM